MLLDRCPSSKWKEWKQSSSSEVRSSRLNSQNGTDEVGQMPHNASNASCASTCDLHKDYENYGCALGTNGRAAHLFYLFELVSTNEMTQLAPKWGLGLNASRLERKFNEYR